MATTIEQIPPKVIKEAQQGTSVLENYPGGWHVEETNDSTIGPSLKIHDEDHHHGTLVRFTSFNILSWQAEPTFSPSQLLGGIKSILLSRGYFLQGKKYAHISNFKRISPTNFIDLQCLAGRKEDAYHLGFAIGDSTDSQSIPNFAVYATRNVVGETTAGLLYSDIAHVGLLGKLIETTAPEGLEPAIPIFEDVAVKYLESPEVTRNHLVAASAGYAIS